MDLRAILAPLASSTFGGSGNHIANLEGTAQGIGDTEAFGLYPMAGQGQARHLGNHLAHAERGEVAILIIHFAATHGNIDTKETGKTVFGIDGEKRWNQGRFIGCIGFTLKFS